MLDDESRTNSLECFSRRQNASTLSFSLVQLILGVPLEIVHGPLRIGLIYLSGVISGGLLTSISDPGEFLAGASGGVYALMLAILPTIVMNWREMKTFFEWCFR